MIATSADSSEVALVTWGRIHDSVDPRALIAEVRRHHAKFDFDFGASIELCYSLSDVSEFEYFFEALWTFARFPQAGNYSVWKREKRAAIRRGEDIYKLGSRRSRDAVAMRRSPGTIAHGFSRSWDEVDVAPGMIETDLRALIDGTVGSALRRLPHVTGLSTDPLLDDEDQPTDRYELLIRTDLPDAYSDPLDAQIIEVYRRTLPRPEPDLLWSFISDDVYRALHPEASPGPQDGLEGT